MFYNAQAVREELVVTSKVYLCAANYITFMNFEIMQRLISKLASGHAASKFICLFITTGVIDSYTFAATKFGQSRINN